MRIRFQLNNTAIEIDAEADERLANVLRRDFGLLSIKQNCAQGVCGACTVLLNNNPVPSCMLPIFTVEGKNIITLEAFSMTGAYKEIISAFEKEGITLCGFCSAGTILTAHSLLQKYGNPSEDQIRNAYSGLICRCTDILSMSAALKRISKTRRNK